MIGMKRRVWAAVLAAGLSLGAAGVAAAEDYRQVGSGNTGDWWVDADSVKTGAGGTRTAWGVVVYNERSDGVAYVKFRSEYDCGQNKTRHLDLEFYKADGGAAGDSRDPTPWDTAKSGTIQANIDRQVCAGKFDEASSRRSLKALLAEKL